MRSSLRNLLSSRSALTRHWVLPLRMPLRLRQVEPDDIKSRMECSLRARLNTPGCSECHLWILISSTWVWVWVGCRWGALSNGGSLSEVLTVIKERGRDHWPKKPYFRRFSARWHRKLWQLVTSKSFVKNILATRSLDSFSPTMVTIAPWSYLQSTASPWRVPGFAKAAGMLLLFLKSR